MIIRKIKQWLLRERLRKDLESIFFNQVNRMSDSFRFWDAVRQTHLGHLKFSRRRTTPDRTTSVYVHHPDDTDLPELKYWEVIPERKKGPELGDRRTNPDGTTSVYVKFIDDITATISENLPEIEYWKINPKRKGKSK